jgi:hypothetical protein
MLGETKDGPRGAPEYCWGGTGKDPDGRLTFGRWACISGNVGISCAPEVGSFRGVT